MNVDNNALKEEESKAIVIKSTAETLIVNDQCSYDWAAQFLIEIKTRTKQIESTMDPICKSAYAAWQTANEMKKKFLAPYQVAEQEVKSRMATYQLEQKKLAEEAEQKAREEAAKQEEKERKKLIKQGRHEEAEMVFVPVVAPSHEVAKTEGVSIISDFDVDIHDLKEFLRALVDGRVMIDPAIILTVKTPPIKRYIQLTKATKIPGVSITEKVVVSARGRS